MAWEKGHAPAPPVGQNTPVARKLVFEPRVAALQLVGQPVQCRHREHRPVHPRVLGPYIAAASDADVALHALP